MGKPIAVLLADVHFSLQTLEVADAATRMAIDKANSLSVPLIVCGDLHDTKANMRGEVVSRMIQTFRYKDRKVGIFVLRGNHDQINEKSQEHSLDFLALIDSVNVIDTPVLRNEFAFIPYQHDPNEFRRIINRIPMERVIIAHQGISGSASGEYIQDKSAISPEDVAARRIISGHYHNRQTIALPNYGQWDYVGNPYTLGFGEANDPDKGFQILMEDGSLEFVPTNLRRHIKIEAHQDAEGRFLTEPHPRVDDADLVWVKWSHDGVPYIKQSIAERLGIKQDFRLDLIPVETETEAPQVLPKEPNALLEEMLKSLSNTTDERKQRLIKMYREMLESK